MSDLILRVRENRKHELKNCQRRPFLVQGEQERIIIQFEYLTPRWRDLEPVFVVCSSGGETSEVLLRNGAVVFDEAVFKKLPAFADVKLIAYDIQGNIITESEPVEVFALVPAR